jgi:DNA-binding YbaB/EbfC family protein
MDFSEMFKNLGGLKEQMEQIRGRVARLTVTGESGAGIVKVTCNGEGEVTDVKIDRNLLGPNDNEMLEELIISAVNDALKKTREAVAHEMKSVTGGLNIPGLDKILGGLGGFPGGGTGGS